MEFDTHARNM